MRAEKIQKILMEDSGGFIAVSKNLITAIGLNEAIVFGELVSKYNYYEKENMLNNGYMYCTYDDLRISTGLSQTAQTNAIKNLEKLNLIKCTIAGFPKKRYITVLDTELSKYLQQGKEKKEQLKEKIRRNQYIDINKMDINKMENNTIDNNTIDDNISVYRNQYNDVSNQFIDINKMDINNMDNNNMDINTIENNMQYIENDMQYIENDMPLYRNQYRIINNNNNKINNNKEIIKEINKNNNLISDTKEEINSFFDTKEENIDNSSLIQKDMIIDYYFEKYNDTYNKTHDKIDNEKISSKIDNFSLSYNINSGTWIELIDYHFSLSSIETNGSIDDFLNDNIIKKYLDSINNDFLDTKEENNDNSSLIQKDMIIDYYFEEYKNAYNKLHDKINKEKIYSKIDNLSLSYNIDNQMWIELIDFHFNLSSLETDGSIYHFLSDNIIKIYLNEVNNFKNSSLVSTKENNLEYAHIDNNIRKILQYFVDRYYSYFGINYWEKEDFYVNDIVKYAKLIELLSSDFDLEVTLDCWKKKIDVFFELDKYDKTLDTFLQFSVINDIIAGQMTNSEYCEECKEYDDVELPF